jgi:hypothetical protein
MKERELNDVFSSSDQEVCFVEDMGGRKMEVNGAAIPHTPSCKALKHDKTDGGDIVVTAEEDSLHLLNKEVHK